MTAPEAQVSSVQALPSSAGRSELSATLEMLPAPSLGALHPWQTPAPSQTSGLLFAPMPQPAPLGLFTCEAIPAEHTSSVQGFLSSGTSRSSFAATVAPAPSHWSCLQSPEICV